MNIVLVGMRGAGKTSVGRCLAGRLGLPLVDTDERLEERHGLRVAEIFARHGEGTFRDWEEDTCLEVLAGRGQVVSLGGGAVLRPRVSEICAAQALPVWLRARPEALVARLRVAPRPALTSLPLEEEVEALVRAREPIYRASTKHVISTDTMTKEQVVYAIEQLWRDLPGHNLR